LLKLLYNRAHQVGKAEQLRKICYKNPVPQMGTLNAKFPSITAQ